MMKVVYVLFKKAGMSREEFRGYWKDTHAPIAKEMQGLKEYIQNHALVDPEGNEPPYDGFDELYFENQEAMEEALASSEGEATFGDWASPGKTDTLELGTMSPRKGGPSARTNTALPAGIQEGGRRALPLI